MSAAIPSAAFVAAAVLAWFAVGRVLGFAERRLLDVPNARSAHAAPTPRGAGLGIVAAIVVCVAAEALRGGDASVAALALPTLAACAVGFLDDRKSLAWAPKLALLVVATALVLPFAVVREVAVPYAGTLDLGALAAPLTVLWLCGFANAFNFMDGLNGMSGFTALVSGAGFCAAGLLAGDPATAFLGAVVAGAGAGFLPWNFPRARIFMGDSGSLPLGTLLAATAVIAARRTGGGAPTLEFPAGVLLLGPYVFDVGFTLIRRAAQGKPLGQAHNEHLYQRLSRGLGGHAPSTLTVAALSAGTASLALAYASFGDLGKVLSLLVPPAVLLACVPFVFRLEALRRRDPAG